MTVGVILHIVANDSFPLRMSTGASLKYDDQVTVYEPYVSAPMRVNEYQLCESPPHMLRGLVVVAHPDDEAIYAGGILASSQIKGTVDWHILCLTNKETPRYQELLKSAAIIGVSAARVHCLNVEDSEEFVATPELRSYVIAKVDELAKGKDILLTHGKDGEYGHVQHQLAYDVCKEVTSALPDASPALLHFGWKVYILTTFYTRFGCACCCSLCGSGDEYADARVGIHMLCYGRVCCTCLAACMWVVRLG